MTNTPKAHDTAMVTLEPCPFCGTADVKLIEVSPATTDRWRVAHDHDKTGFDCYVAGPVRTGQAEAIAAWNTRTASQAELLEALEGVVSSLAMTRNILTASKIIWMGDDKAADRLAKARATIARIQGEQS